MSAGYHGYSSIFRASNLQPARRLLEELQQNPISYQPKFHPPDARGYSKSSRGCWEIHADCSAEGSCVCVCLCLSSAVPSHHACGAGLALRHPLSLPPPGAAALRQPGPSSLLPPQDQCLHCSGGLVSSRSQTSHTHTHTCEHLCVASLLVLGLRNMEGSVDPPKMVSQFLVRKTLVQVRRRILQCCRPGFPDNLVKVTTSVCWAGSGSWFWFWSWAGSDLSGLQAYRYQGLLEAMPLACRHVHPAQQRPPVEREEHLLPLWLAVGDVITSCCHHVTCPWVRVTAVLVSVPQRSLPVLHLVVSHYNSPCGSPQTLPHRSAGARHSHMSIARSMSKSTSKSCSFPPGTRYPERIPRNLDLKRIGFVLLQQPDRHTPDSAPLPDGHLSGSAPLPDSGSRSSSTHPPLSFPRKLKKSSSTVSLTTTEKIQLHFQTLIGLRRRQDGGSEAPPSPPQSPTPFQVEAAETKDINGSSEEEEEEQSEVFLALSDSSSEELLEPPEVEPEQEQRRNLDGAEGVEPREEEEEEPKDAQREEEEGDDARRQQQEQLFAQEYLLRVSLVCSSWTLTLLCSCPLLDPDSPALLSPPSLQVCAAVHQCPDVAEQLLQVLDGFSAAPASPERLYSHLRGVLGPWPQLLRDFAAFLTRRQARRCGLVGGASLKPRPHASAPAHSAWAFLHTASGAAAFPAESAVSMATGEEPGRRLRALSSGGVSAAEKLHLHARGLGKGGRPPPPHVLINSNSFQSLFTRSESGFSIFQSSS